MFKVLLIGCLIAVIVSYLYLRQALRPMFMARWAERARRQFLHDRQTLESEFFQLASTSGKPRGLAWKSCAFQDAIRFARDRGNGDLVGLVGVTIGFEAIPGGGMEEVEAVGNLRAATAIFTHDGHRWSTAGRAVFNLEPRELVERYRESLDPI